MPMLAGSLKKRRVVRRRSSENEEGCLLNLTGLMDLGQGLGSEGLRLRGQVNHLPPTHQRKRSVDIFGPKQLPMSCWGRLEVCDAVARIEIMRP